MDAPASMVELWVPPRVPGALSILELQASDPVFDRVASAPLPVKRPATACERMCAMCKVSAAGAYCRSAQAFSSSSLNH